MSELLSLFIVIKLCIYIAMKLFYLYKNEALYLYIHRLAGGLGKKVYRILPCSAPYAPFFGTICSIVRLRLLNCLAPYAPL